MASRVLRVVAMVFCALPAFGFDVRTRDRGVVASFTFACPEYRIPPRVRTKTFTNERFAAKTGFATILSFEKGAPPTQPHSVIGEVEVLQRGSRTDLQDLRDKAQEAAEKMGGDALMDVESRDAGRTEPKVGERGFLVFTAKVIRWEERGDSVISR